MSVYKLVGLESKTAGQQGQYTNITTYFTNVSGTGKAWKTTTEAADLPEETRAFLRPFFGQEKISVDVEADIDRNSQFWRLKSCRAATPEEVKAAATRKYSKKGNYDTTGVKVGHARNEAVETLKLLMSINPECFAEYQDLESLMDHIDQVAYSIVKRQAIQEDTVRKGAKEEQAANEMENKGPSFDDLPENDPDVPF